MTRTTVILLFAPLFYKVPSPLTSWRVCPANATLRPKVSIQNPNCRRHGGGTEARGPRQVPRGVRTRGASPRRPAQRRRSAGRPRPAGRPTPAVCRAGGVCGAGRARPRDRRYKSAGGRSPPRLLAAAPPARLSRPPTCGCGGPRPR